MKRRGRKISLIIFSLLMAATLCSCGSFRGAFSDCWDWFYYDLCGQERGLTPEEEEALLHQAQVEAGVEELLTQLDGNYAYGTLTEEEQRLYAEMLYGILYFEEEMTLSTLDTDQVEKVYYAILCDRGDLYWSHGYSYVCYRDSEGELLQVGFRPVYTKTQEETEELAETIEAVAADWLADLPEDAGDYEKVKYVFEFLIANVDYNGDSLENQNLLSVFLYQETVCQGYACAAQYLLRQLGVECLVVTGTVEESGHAWNLVNIDGAWYHMDVTWGNSSYVDANSEELINYNYLCMTDEEILSNHVITMPISLPSCNSREANYYVQIGAYLDSWDEKALGEMISVAFQEGNASVSIKFAGESLFERAVEVLFGQNRIFFYCRGVEELLYYEDTEFWILTIWF